MPDGSPSYADPRFVLLEVGPAGLPHRMMSDQGRRVGGALAAAADISGNPYTKGMATIFGNPYTKGMSTIAGSR